MSGSEKNNIFLGQKGSLIVFLLLCGVLLRFYHQFLIWSVNGDEVDLGLDILNHSFGELFYPFQSRQSAPPFFLLFEKVISQVGKPFLSLRILPFLCSCFSLFLFNRLLRMYFPLYLQLILLSLFCFNPFIIENSLLLKQYSLDLMFGLLAVNYFLGNKRGYYVFGFYVTFCFFSNVGLFFCASIFIFLLLRSLWASKRLDRVQMKGLSPLFLAPIPYLIFFFWFMEQPGATIMKDYMVGFWSGAFMPTDLSFFKWIAIKAKTVMFFFLSTYWLFGIPLLLLFLIGIFSIALKSKRIFQRGLMTITAVYIITALMHLSVSAMEMYPFSDRLILYLAPGIYFAIGFAVLELKEKNYKTKYKIGYYAGVVILSCTIVSYFQYQPRKVNDVATLMRFIKSEDQTVAFTSKAKKLSLDWLAFTQLSGLRSKGLLSIDKFETGWDKEAAFLITVQNTKFGHLRRLSNPEPIVPQLIAQDKLVLHRRIGGYAIYKIKKTSVKCSVE